jgi:hypothetical protein
LNALPVKDVVLSKLKISKKIVGMKKFKVKTWGIESDTFRCDTIKRLLDKDGMERIKHTVVLF